MASKIKNLVSSAASSVAQPGALYQRFIKWIRFQGGAMDTYYLSGTEKDRKATGGDVEKQQWSYRYPAPG
jgi:hypothetical protein